MKIFKVTVKKWVRFAIVGAFALAYHGLPRNTRDIDIWIYPPEDNSPKNVAAIKEFFATTLVVTAEDIASGKIIQFGRNKDLIDANYLDNGST